MFCMFLTSELMLLTGTVSTRKAPKKVTKRQRLLMHLIKGQMSEKVAD